MSRWHKRLGLTSEISSRREMFLWSE